jgi:hypothetical protein
VDIPDDVGVICIVCIYLQSVLLNEIDVCMERELKIKEKYVIQNCVNFIICYFRWYIFGLFLECEL